MEWKIRQSALWPADHEEWTDDCAEFSEPDVSSDPGDEDLHLVDADGVEVSADIAREYVREGMFQNDRVLEEFATWANTRKGHCVVCGDLPVEVDTDDGGIEQSTITIRCPHGVLVVQYYIVATVATRAVRGSDLIDNVVRLLGLTDVEDSTKYYETSWDGLTPSSDSDLRVPVVLGERVTLQPGVRAKLEETSQYGSYSVRVWRARKWDGTRGYWIRRDWGASHGYSACGYKAYFERSLPRVGEGIKVTAE